MNQTVPHIPHIRTLPQPPRRIPNEEISRFKAAIASNDLDEFENLLRLHLNSESSQSFVHDLCPVMDEAVREDHAMIVTKLLGYGMKIHYSFVLQAIQAKAKSSVNVFIQNGWNINTPISATESTVLAYAITNKEMVFWLLDHGADLNKQTYIDLTAMSRAVELAPPDLIRELLDRGGNVGRGELLQHALDRPTDTVEVLGMLLDRGAQLDSTMYQHHENSARLYPFMGLGTPLHTAATMGKADIVRYLLGRKADPTIRDTKGQTAMECAKDAGYDEVAGILKSALEA